MEDFCDPVPEDAQRMLKEINVFKIQSIPKYYPKLFCDVAMLLKSVIIEKFFFKKKIAPKTFFNVAMGFLWIRIHYSILDLIHSILN